MGRGALIYNIATIKSDISRDKVPRSKVPTKGPTKGPTKVPTKGPTKGPTKKAQTNRRLVNIPMRQKIQ